MKLYIAFILLVILSVNSLQNDNSNQEAVIPETPNEKGLKFETLIPTEVEPIHKSGVVSRFKRARKQRPVEDDDDDEGGFISTGSTTDHDFLADVTACPKDHTPAPWGKCLTCSEYKAKLGKIGAGC